MKSKLLLLFILLMGIYNTMCGQTAKSPVVYPERSVSFNHPDGPYTNELLKEDFGNGIYPLNRGFAFIEDNVYKIWFRKGEKVDHTGASVQLDIIPKKKYTLEYRIKYDARFQAGLHGKQFGFVIGVGYDGGRGEEARVNGDGGGARLQFDAHENMISNQLYVYHSRMQGKYGENVGGQKFSMPKGEWNTIKMTVTLEQTENAGDGRIEVWCNGEKKMDVKDICFVRKESARQITRLSFESFPGGGGAIPLYDNYLYVDDLRWFAE